MGYSGLIVHPKKWRSPHPFQLQSGRKLPFLELGYETYGELNPRGDNAVLICHALTHSSHVAGKHRESDLQPGWWDGLVGPGKYIDTDNYFVICINCLGGCHGSTGPASQNPETGKPFGGDFPVITISDMVVSQKMLADHLGIDHFFAVIGGCMGGFQVLEWMVHFPEKIKNAVSIATAPQTSAHSLALWEVIRQAVMSDPKWQKGHYYETGGPVTGMGLASIFGMMLWMSPDIMAEKFGRRRLPGADAYTLEPEFEIQQFFRELTRNPGGSIDPNTLIFLTRAMDYFDITLGKPSLQEKLESFSGNTLLISYDSDWRYPPREMEKLNHTFQAAHISSTHKTLKSAFGHGAFHIEPVNVGREIKAFLSMVRAGH